MTNGRASNFVVASMILLALILFLAPADVSEKVSRVVRESLKPGLLVVFYGKEFWNEVEEPAANTELAQLQQQVGELQKELRAERALTIQLYEKIVHGKKYFEFPFRSQKSETLVIPELVSARLLSNPLQQAWKQQKLLDVGTNQGVAESHWVLKSEEPILDLGTDHRVEPEDLVLLGKVVLGRISQVGKWSSTVQGVTDETFSARARLIRKLGQQYISGSEGLLIGTGKERCKLTLISNEEIVSVGDEVYTVVDESPQGYPLLFGKVVQAELKPGSLEWEIDVQPTVNQVGLTEVEVLRQRVNPERMVAQETRGLE